MAVIASGDWWRIEDGTLFVYCVGDMPDYAYDGNKAPWYDDRNSVTAVVISDGVTDIGDAAFYDCQMMTSATIPNGVTYIGEDAFMSCVALASVIIPVSVTYIESGAFYNCPGVTDVYYGGSDFQLNGIEVGYFNENFCDAHFHCTQSPDPWWTVANGTLSIFCNGPMPDYGGLEWGRRVIQYAPWGYAPNAGDIVSIVIADGVTSIGHEAFYFRIYDEQDGDYKIVANVASVTIPASVVSIGRDAFGDRNHGGCASLTDVYYGGTESQWNEVEVWGGNDSLLTSNIHFNWSPEPPPPPPIPIPPGAFSVAVSYTHDGQTFTTSFQLNMVSSYRKITAYPAKTDYAVGETLDYAGLKVTEFSHDGTTVDVTSHCVVTPPDGTEATEAGDIMVDVSYNGTSIGTFWVAVT